MKKLYLILLVFFTLQANATHIVGGEFELLSTNPATNQYRISLNVYFDDVNGDPGALDQTFRYSIFEKVTNTRKRDDNLPLSVTSFVPYTNQACAIGSLRTQKLIYTKLITLDPTIYNSPRGYYIAAERCCRNVTISNIIAPGASGQTFYLEFPAVVKNNTPFINSSPKLFPPLSDYACNNTLFYFDFSGDDPDGDSLVYEMVAPFKGYSQPSPGGNPAPVPSPAPYPTVDWQSGLSANNQIPGNPTINIDRLTGQLTLVPNRLGLFVFGIKCEEYRNNIKIGEVRRDFQILVINCPTNEKPDIQVKIPGSANFYNPQDTIRINVSSVSRCLNFYLSDPDLNERVVASIKPLNFSSNELQLTNSSGTINTSGTLDSLIASVCIPNCFNTNGKVYQLQAIVKDDGCSLPKQDTIVISFIVDPIPNTPPAISSTALPAGYVVKVGDTINFQVTGLDPDNDKVTLTATGQNFNISSQSISFNTASGQGNVTSNFSWIVNCNALQQDSFLIKFTATSESCGIKSNQDIIIPVRVNYTNQLPVLTSLLNSTNLVLKVGEPLSTTFTGTDLDLDELNLTAAGIGFNLASAGIRFTNATGKGSVTSALNWTPDCDDLNQEFFTIEVKLTEKNCRPGQPQVYRFNVQVIPPDNQAPELTATLTNFNIDVPLNQAFLASFSGKDLDLNELELTATGVDFNLEEHGFKFKNATGFGQVESKLEWTPACINVERDAYTIEVKLQEKTCLPAPAETMLVTLRVLFPEIPEFIPANIFTPNDDEVNDFFVMPTLPPDFCETRFSKINIYNRWGSKVYESEDRNFAWSGKNVSDGVYFYVITYSNKTFKGTVTIVR